MSIHEMEFNKPVIERHKTTQPTSVHWVPKEVKHKPIRLLGGLRWEMFSQNDNSITSKETTELELELGVSMTRDIYLISLRPAKRRT